MVPLSPHAQDNAIVRVRQVPYTAGRIDATGDDVQLRDNGPRSRSGCRSLGIGTLTTRRNIKTDYIPHSA
jgi:hypothetical protein